jgi:RHS repeat-associated protein
LEEGQALVLDPNGIPDAVDSEIFALTGKLPAQHGLRLQWIIRDQNELEHSAIFRLNSSSFPYEIAVEDGVKKLTASLPNLAVGSHMAKLTVRNQYGFEFYASFPFIVVPDDGDETLEPTAAAPFILRRAVQPVPVEQGLLSEVETGVGEIREGELIFLPFSEPIVTGTLAQLRQQVRVELGPLGVFNPDYQPWPVTFLNKNLDEIQDDEELDGLYIRPEGLFPGGHVLRVSVSAAGGIRDTGFDAVDPQPLEEIAEFGDGLHYRARWATQGIASNIQPFTRNAVVDYAKYRDWLFELSWSADRRQQVLCYKVSPSGQLKLERTIDLTETESGLLSAMNYGGREIAFWPSDLAADGVPGYVLVGYQVMKQSLGSAQTKTLRPARFKMFDPDAAPGHQVVGGIAFGQETGEKVRHLAVEGKFLLATTQWSGVFVVDLAEVVQYYRENGFDNVEGKPYFNVALGFNQPATAIVERYFPLQYPREFTVAGAIGSPFEMEPVRVPRASGLGNGLNFFGTGGIELGAWFHGDPPVEFLLSGFDGSYFPFDPDGQETYDTQAQRLKNWDLNEDRVDDRRIYFSGTDTTLANVNALMGQAAIPAKFSPIMIKVFHQVQTEMMAEPRDVLVMRSNPRGNGDVHGGLMFAIVDGPSQINYLAYLRFDSAIKNIDINQELMQVATVANDGRVMVIDVPTWIDFGLRFDADPMDPELVAINATISNPLEPIGRNQFLPGLLIDEVISHARYPLAFLNDRVVVGDGKEQSQIELRPPLFINPGFYSESSTGQRSRIATIEVITGTGDADDSGDKTKIKVTFNLREDAEVDLQLLNEEGGVIETLYSSTGDLLAGKGINTHTLIFPLDKLGVTESDLSGATVPISLQRKLRLEGRPKADRTAVEYASLWVEMHTDPWGSGPLELEAAEVVEAWSGRLALVEEDLPSLPAVGVGLPISRRYTSHGHWSGSLGRGWHLAWDAHLLWQIRNSGDAQWMEIHLPSGEVVRADYDDFGWNPKGPRFEGKDIFAIDATFDNHGVQDSEGGFPREVILNWGDTYFVYEYARHRSSATFPEPGGAQPNSDVFYVLNESDDFEVPDTDSAKLGRYVLKEWRKDVGQGLPGEGWIFEHDAGLMQRMRSTVGDFEVALSYRRHPENHRLGLNKITVGDYEVTYEQEEEIVDFLALKEAFSNTFPSKAHYTYQPRQLGSRLDNQNRALPIWTLQMSQQRDRFQAVSNYTVQLQSDQDVLPLGMFWPYVSQIQRNGFYDSNFTYLWSEDVAGRTLEVTRVDSYNGASETFTTSYRQLNQDRPEFLVAQRSSRNGFSMEVDWSNWPNSQVINYPNGLEVTQFFDDWMRLTRTRREAPDTPVNSLTYSYLGDSSLLTEQSGTNDVISTFSYDELGRLLKINDGFGGEETHFYSEPHALPTREIDETGTVTHHRYDVLGRPTFYRRLGYTETTTYRKNGFRVAVAGEAGLQYSKQEIYEISSDETRQITQLSSNAPATAPSNSTSIKDPWGRVLSFYRAGRMLYEVDAYHLGGPLRETLNWSHRGSEQVTTYGEARANGFYATNLTIDGQLVSRMTNDEFGNVTEYRDFINSAIIQSSFNSQHQLRTQRVYNLDGGEIGRVLEDLEIAYPSLTEKVVTRNGQTYTVTTTPGDEWQRRITGSFGEITHRGRGYLEETVVGTVEGSPVERVITRSAGTETIEQIQSPKAVEKLISGDGRVYSITSGHGTLEQQFNGYGEVRLTKMGPLEVYKLEATNAHFQRTRWSAGGQTYRATYNGGQLQQMSKNNVITMDVTGWDFLARATQYRAGKNTITVDFDSESRTREIANRAPDNNSEISTRVRMDGLGRIIEKTVSEGVPDTPVSLKRVTYSFQYGNGIGEGRTGPGDRIIRMTSPRKVSNYYYGSDGRLIRTLQGDPPESSGKRMPDAVPGYEIQRDEEQDTEGNLVKVETLTGPDGVTVVNKYDAQDRLLERSREDILLLQQRHDAEGRLILQRDRMGRLTTYRYEGDREVPAEVVFTAGEEVHITLFEYNDALLLTGKRERVEIDDAGEYVGGVYWRYRYDDRQRLTSIERSINGSDYHPWQAYTYDINPSSANDHRVTDPSGITWTHSYDPEDGSLISRTNDLGNFSEGWTVSEDGRTSIYNRDNAYFVEIEYDFLGRILRHQVYDHRETDQRTFDQVWSYTYEDDVPTPVAEQHPDGRRIERDFDAIGNPAETRFFAADPNTEPYVVTTVFDDYQRLAALSTNTGQEALFSYDRMGQIESETWRLAAHPQELVTRYGYDARGNMVSTRYPSGRQLQRSFNEAGRITGIFEAGQLQSSYQYTSFGQLLGFEQAGATAAYDYDILGRLTAYRFDPGSEGDAIREETFGYAPIAGMVGGACDDAIASDSGHPDALRCHSLRWGNVALDQTYAYDALGRLRQHAVTQAAHIPGVQPTTLDYHYGALGNVTHIDTDYGPQTYLYNGDGSVRERAYNGFRTVFDYDGAGRVTRETEHGAQGLATGFVREFGYDHRGLLSSVTERGPTQTQVQEFEYDFFSRLRGMRNGNFAENPWNVFTLSQPRIPGNSDLPIPLAAGPRTEEVLLPANASRDQAQVLGYGYGPQGLAHVTAQPTDSWQRGSISHQFTDPFQNTVAILSPRSLNAASDQPSPLAMAQHHNPQGQGATLDVTQVTSGPGETVEGFLGQHWDVSPAEMAQQSGSAADPAQAHALLQTFIPGFSGNHQVGGTLAGETGNNGEANHRLGLLGGEELPLGGMHDMGTRLYHPQMGAFTSPDTWAMYRPGDHFTANRFLYANADPVNFGDFDGRLSSLKTTMGYIGGRGVADLAINTEARDRLGYQARNDANSLRAKALVAGIAMNFVPVKGGFFAEMAVSFGAEKATAGMNVLAGAHAQYGTAVEMFGTGLGMDVGGELFAEATKLEFDFSKVAEIIVNKKLPKPPSFAEAANKFFQGLLDQKHLGIELAFEKTLLLGQQAMGMPSYSGDILVDGGTLNQAVGEDLGVGGDAIAVQSMFNSAFCFTADTQVLTAKGLEPIEHIHVGRRVLTYDADEDDAEEEPRDPANYRLVSLELERNDASGEIVVVHTLIDRDWLEASHASVGRWVWFAIEEMGVAGPAQITEIEPCPELEEGPGRLVLTTFQTRNRGYLQVSLQGEETPLEVTGNHAFYSLDREDWVPANRLSVGEKLQTETGFTFVTGVEAVDTEEPFFNIEVDDNHNYYVTETGVLTHNASKAATALKIARRAKVRKPNPNRPGGHQTFDVGEHGVLSPGGNRANGFSNTRADRMVQSHHFIQNEWAVNNIAKYRKNKGIAILLESISGAHHAEVSRLQTIRRNARKRRGEPTWGNHGIRQEFQYAYRDLIDAGVPAKHAKRVARKAYKYFEELEAFK